MSRLLNVLTAAVLLQAVPAGCRTHTMAGDFVPYISAIPDSMATESQIRVKKALEEIIYTEVSVKDGRYVFHFGREDFRRLGISWKYCGWLKRSMREENRNYRKLLRQNPDLQSGASLEEMFESAKKEYLEDPGKTAEPEVPMMDLFRCGAPVACPEDNLRNLFRNWTESGADSSGIKLLSYSYEGTAEDMRQLGKYVRHNHSAGMPYWSWSCNCGKDRLIIETVDAGRKSAKDRRFASGALLTHFVSPGDHVFSVKFSCAGREHVYYIFVKPDTDRAVTAFNAFGTEFPTSAILRQ